MVASECWLSCSLLFGGDVLPLTSSCASSSVFSSSRALLLRILKMFRAVKVSKSLLLTLGRPCFELLRALPAEILAV